MAIRNTDLGGTDWYAATTLLDGAISDSTTTIDVDDVSDFQSSGTIKIENELITYTGTSSGAAGDSFTGCTRGAYDSTAASHSDNTTVDECEKLTAADLNDTFDAAVTKIQSLSAFWLNSDLYDVYDDFDSYSTGTLTTNTNWTVFDNSTGSDWGSNVEISATTYAGGTSKELLIEGTNDNNATGDNLDVGVTSRALENNKHVFAGYYISDLWRTLSDTDDRPMYQVSIDGGSNYYNVCEKGYTYNGDILYGSILVVALGSDNYDLYIGRKKVQSNVNVADLEITFRIYVVNAVGAPGANAYSRWYIDDIRQAKSETS